ncbi:18684_t:CDS:1, partial [Racocetra persica]
TISNIQVQQHITMIHRQLNYRNFNQSTLKVQLQQIQNVAITIKSILEHYDYTLLQSKYNTSTAKMLQH